MDPIVTPATTMRAAVQGWTGGISVVSDYKTPTCGPSQVRVRVKAAAINPVDYKLGRALGPVPGLDVAGVMDMVGDNVTQFKVGDEVYGQTGGGSLAEYTLTKPESLGLKSSKISFVEAAAMPITYLTSLQSLRDAGGLKCGARVLIIGASGGCGIAALQIAKALGAGHIAAVCSGKNEPMVREHGAHEVIDYTKEDLLEHFNDVDESEKFDIVYDAATASGGGEDYRSKSLKLLCSETQGRSAGQYVAINGAASMWLRNFTIGQKKNEHLVMTNANTADLDCISDMVSQGHLKPVIALQLPLTEENVKQGFDLLKSRRAVGKVVFDLELKD